ncbi:MAG: V-type ATP synthase subunit I [Methanobrevibacter sp.]|nr:V-type ATP synthase subunit I [Methanobrevibacter sp.]
MFQTARMRKLKIISLNQYSDSIVQTLHEEGIVQIDDVSERIQQNPDWKNLLEPSKITPLTGRLSSLLMKTTGLSELLGDALTGDLGMKDMLKSFISPEIPEKKEIENIKAEDLIVKAENLLDEVESQTKVIENQKNVLSSKKSELIAYESIANKMLKLDMDLAILNDTKYTSTIVGRIDAESANKFKEKSVKITDKLLILEESANTEDKNTSDEIIVIVTLNEFKEEISALLRKFEFEKFEIQGLSGKPSEIITSIKSELDSLDAEENNLNSQLKEIAEKWDDEIIVLKEQLEIEKDRNEIFASFAKTDKTVFLEAWVPLKDVDKVKSLVDYESEGHCEIEVENIGEDDTNVPVLQNNPSFAKPYEFLVGLYAPVKYNEVDPTILFWILFPFIFGFCLTDTIYGALFAIMGVIAVRGVGKTSEAFHSLGMISIYCGVWGTVLGFLTNGFMGDFLLRFFGFNSPLIIIDAFAVPQIVLIIALAFGLFHVNMGLIIGTINKFRYGEKKEALGSNIVWLILEVGIIFLALGFMMPSIGMIGMGIGGVCVAATLAILLYTDGAFGLMNIFSFMGNILSYARLLALCLSTAGIAMTINILAALIGDMIPIPIIGMIIFVIIIVFGHIANFLIQIMGGFINTLRLHFVEFFAQFYMGGRNAFKPFNSNRTITKLKK